MRISLALVAIIIVVFVLQQTDPRITESLKLSSGKALEEPWILISSMFLHADIVHLLFNSLGIALFGSILEEIIGKTKFIALFFMGGIFASIVAAFYYPSALGASGAIFAIIGATAVLRPLMVVWVSYLPMPMFLAAISWAAADLFGFIIPSNVAHVAHLGGLFFGIIFAFIIRGKKPLFPHKKKHQDPVSKSEFDNWERSYLHKQK